MINYGIVLYNIIIRVVVAAINFGTVVHVL